MVIFLKTVVLVVGLTIALSIASLVVEEIALYIQKKRFQKTLSVMVKNAKRVSFDELESWN